MNSQIKQVVGLTVFASVCMAIGMGLGRGWIVTAQADKPVAVNVRPLDHMQPIVEIAEKLNPTVVYVENISYVKVRNNNRFFSGPDSFFDYFYGPTPRQNPSQDDTEIPRTSGGSGFFISHDGEILTNSHVVEGINGSENPKIVVKTTDGKRYPAIVIGKDKALDVALIKIDIQHAPYVKLGDSDSIKVGEWVVAIGNPLGLEHTVTQGIISAKGRTSNVMGADDNLVAGFLQTDAAINRGNSGGPLFNLNGEAVGINAAIRADGQNIGFAVPITPVKHILRELRTGKPLSRGWLGVNTSDLDQDFQESLNASEGALVQGVSKSSPAEKVGIKRLDVIVGVDGKPVKSSSDLVDAIASRRDGDVVKLELIRNGRRQIISVTLGDRRNIDRDSDSDDGSSTDSSRKESAGSLNLEKTYGFRAEALNAQTRRTYQVPDDVTGVVITKVQPRSSASDKRLAAGMIIQSVGTKEIKNIDEFRSEVQKFNGKAIILSLRAREGRGSDGFSEPFSVAIPAMQTNK
ncbi:MAG: trypsin-like peptidase domain-containing protein [Holophagales bacterium]|jgi:serine protease Do|nr:trypsin-like peptidase domain-containing protein [Holophagales bacterium]